jgi:hypothetical protein
VTYFCSYLQVIFTCHKIAWNGALGFTSSPKEDVLWIFITLKNPLPQPGLNTNLGSNGKHTNHCTTEAPCSDIKYVIFRPYVYC